MKKIESLRDVLIHEIQDIYNAEKQLIKALPKMARKASSSELKEAFNHHLKQTEEHVKRLEEVFEELDHKATGVVCHATKGLIEETEELLEQKEGPCLDAALIGAAQKIEHYEIASYGTIIEWAKNLGEDGIVTILSKTIKEEGETDEALTKLARQHTNKEAVSA